MIRLALAAAVLASLASPALAQQWVASWTGSSHGPEKGASDQTFRLIVSTRRVGPQARIRLSNAFGTKPVTFDGAFVGLQESVSALVPGTNAAVTFGGQKSVTVAPGKRGQRSGGAAVRQPGRSDAARPQARGQLPCRGRERTDDLARQGTADLLHQRAGQRRARRRGRRGSVPLLDRVLVLPRRGRHDGASRHQGDRRVRRFDHRRHRHPPSTATTAGPTCCPAACTRPTAIAFAVVNAGHRRQPRGRPRDYRGQAVPRRPRRSTRLDRDVISLPGVAAVIWLEGINDFGTAGTPAETVRRLQAGRRAHPRRRSQA